MSKKTLLIIVSVIAACMYFIVSTIFMPAGGPPPLAITGTVTDAQSGQPIAEAKVFDDGYSEPDWEKIESGYYEPNLPHYGAVTDTNGNYAFLTWPEHHSFKAEAADYKTKRATLYSGHFTINKKDEEVFNFALEWE